MPKNLTGCYLLLDAPDGASYSISRFAQPLSDTLYLAQILDPHSGEPFEYEGRFVLDVNDLAHSVRRDNIGWPRARIFSNWDECRRFIAEIETPRPDTVLKLVKRHD